MAKKKRKGVPASKRKKHAGKGSKGIKKGTFPVYSARTARSALKLRGHAPGKKAVVYRVAKFASKTGNKALKNAVAKARKVDKER